MIEKIVPIQKEYLSQVREIEIKCFEDPWPMGSFVSELTNKWSWFKGIGIQSSERPFLQLSGFIVCWMLYGDLHLLNLAIHPDFRRRGLARILLSDALEEFGRQGGGLVSLEVRQSNQSAQKLYLSSGFSLVGRRPRYYRLNQEDALVMVRKVDANEKQLYRIGN